MVDVSSERAITLLRESIDAAGEGWPRPFETWHEGARMSLRAAYGPDDPQIARFDAISFLPVGYVKNLTSSHEVQEAHEAGMDRVMAMLNGAIREVLARSEEVSAVAPFDDAELVAELEVVVLQLHAVVEDEDLAIAPEDRADLGSDVQSAAAQLRAERPNRKVIRAALERARRIAVGAAVAGGIVQGVDVILKRLGI
jgi:hypothetical protein